MTKRRLRITVLDLVSKGPARRPFQRVMNANLAGIMPQAVAAWCEELGHEVRYTCSTGFDDLLAGLESECDVLIVAACTRSAQAAYAISNLYRRSGTVTVLGGPHASCYPEDAMRYFDCVLGLTDKAILEQALSEAEPHRREGVWFSAKESPSVLPPLQQRWKFVVATLEKARFIKFVPMLVDSGDLDQLRGDLQFLQGQLKAPIVAWHDSDFGTRFAETMAAIEDAVPQGGMRFLAGCDLATLTAENLQRMRRNGFVGVFPEVGSWQASGVVAGLDAVRAVAAQVNAVLSEIPYVQTHFLLGRDGDRGEDSFELIRHFIDLAPAAYPVFSLQTAYGAGAPINLEFQRTGRVVPVPFHFLDGSHAMNVRPLHYSWDSFYANVEYITRYAYAPARLAKRFVANRGWPAKLINLIRARSSRQARFQGRMRRLLIEDTTLRGFFDGRSSALPEFYRRRIERQLGPLWNALPEGALMHDPNAALKRAEAKPRSARGAAE